MNRGKLVILGILGAAIFAAGIAWWFQFHQGHQALAFWGGETARTIRLAKPVWAQRIVRLGDVWATGPLLTVDGESYQIQSSREITKARGLVHARQALIQNLSFDWSDSGTTNDTDWTFAIRFGETDQETLLLDLTNRRIRHKQRPQWVGLKIADGLEVFLSEQFETNP